MLQSKGKRKKKSCPNQWGVFVHEKWQLLYMTSFSILPYSLLIAHYIIFTVLYQNVSISQYGFKLQSVDFSSGPKNNQNHRFPRRLKGLKSCICQ